MKALMAIGRSNTVRIVGPARTVGAAPAAIIRQEGAQQSRRIAEAAVRCQLSAQLSGGATGPGHFLPASRGVLHRLSQGDART